MPLLDLKPCNPSSRQAVEANCFFRSCVEELQRSTGVGTKMKEIREAYATLFQAGQMTENRFERVKGIVTHSA
jgi:hypothetical protein